MNVLDNAKGKHKGIFIFLAIAISFILPWSSSYSNYNVLIEADFLFLGQKFESGDLDDLLIDKQKNFVPSGYDFAYYVGAHLLEPSAEPSYPITVVEQTPAILRC